MSGRLTLNESTASRLPFVTLALSALAGAVLLVPDWGAMLVYDRAAIAAGQWWRLASGHLTHWNFDHLLWDVLMFGVLGAMIESRSRRQLLCVLGLSTAAICATLWIAAAGVAEYRGLSGIDSALFTCLAVILSREARGQGKTLVAGGMVLAVTGLAAKIGYELASGATLFVDSAAAGFVPLPLVHAVGGVCGLAAAWTASRGPVEFSWSKQRGGVKACWCSTSAAKAVTPSPGT